MPKSTLSEHLAELPNDRVDLPVALNSFLCWLLCGDNIMSDTNAPAPSLEKRMSLENDALQRSVLSIGPDIVYCASNGKIKTHKHLALPVAVKHITGSSQLVTLLNRLGHSVSDSQISELDTAVAED